MYKVNKYGQSYKIGTRLCTDLQNKITELAQFSLCRDVSQRFGVSPATVSNMVKRYHETGSTNPQQRSNIGKYSKVSFDNSVLLETIVQAQPLSCLDETKCILTE